MVPCKVIEDLEGAGVWGGLAPIIEVRISGPPGSGSLRAWILLFGGMIFERSIVRCSGSAMVPCKVIEDLEGAGALGRLSPNKKKRPPGLDDSRVSKSGSFLLSHLV